MKKTILTDDEKAEQLPLSLSLIAKKFLARTTCSDAHKHALNLFREQQRATNSTASVLSRKLNSLKTEWQIVSGMKADLSMTAVHFLKKLPISLDRIDSWKFGLQLAAAETVAMEMLRVYDDADCARFLHRSFSPEYAVLLSTFAEESGYSSLAKIMRRSPHVEVIKDSEIPKHCPPLSSRSAGVASWGLGRPFQ